MNASFQRSFFEEFETLMQTTFAPERVLSVIADFEVQLSPEMQDIWSVGLKNIPH